MSDEKSTTPVQTNDSTSEAVLRSITWPLTTTSTVLQVGGDGSVLSAMQRAGYTRLRGLVPDPDDVTRLRAAHPELSAVEFLVGDPATALVGLPDDAVSLLIALDDTMFADPGSGVARSEEIARVASAVLVSQPADGAPGPIAEAMEPHGFGELVRAPVESEDGAGSTAVVRLQRMDTQESLHRFWRQAEVPGNVARTYIGPVGRSQALLKLIGDLPADAAILEVGCNVGRNLAYLYDHGYHNLQGIEINEHAVTLLRETYPQLADVPIHVGTAGERLPELADDSLDLSFTMAVIEHLHPAEAGAVFDAMVRTSTEVLAIEPTGRRSHRNFPHDVHEVFTSRGMRQTLERPMTDFEEWGRGGGLEEFIARRFVRD